MNKKRILSVCILLVITLLLQFIPVAYADETNNSNEESTEIAEVDTQEEQKEVEKQEEKEENKTEKTEAKVENNQDENNLIAAQNPNEEYKVAVITTKVDENGNPLKGAVLQILDSNGNVIDEWTSDGEEHTSLLPEGDYTLHEKEAPEGYKLALDKTFTVKVVETNVTATTDHDDSACTHYPTELYYIESNGVKEEVYCVNQGWGEPNNINYDGIILTEDNILDFLPDADPTMTAKELYDKVLDIIYHRTQIEDGYLGLTNSEIRLITEYAIKNYTSALYNNGNWARRFSYSEDTTAGYVLDIGNGNSIGKLAEHWWTKHGEKLPQKYADYYFYLVRDEDHHPVDMHLYIYSSGAGSEDDPYQNLLSVKWHNRYDENHKVHLTMINEKEPEKEKKVKKTSIIANPQTGDNIVSYVITLVLSLGSLAGVSSYRRKEF